MEEIVLHLRISIMADRMPFKLATKTSWISNTGHFSRFNREKNCVRIHGITFLTQPSTTRLCGLKPRKIRILSLPLKTSKPKLITHFQQKAVKFRYGDRSEIIFKDSILTPLVAIQILGSRAMVRFFSFSYFDN